MVQILWKIVWQFFKMLNILTLWSSKSITRYMSKRNENICLHKNSIQCDIIWQYKRIKEWYMLQHGWTLKTFRSKFEELHSLCFEYGATMEHSHRIRCSEEHRRMEVQMTEIWTWCHQHVGVGAVAMIKGWGNAEQQEREGQTALRKCSLTMLLMYTWTKSRVGITYLKAYFFSAL